MSLCLSFSLFSLSRLLQAAEGSVQPSRGNTDAEQNNEVKAAAGREAAIAGWEQVDDNDGLYSRASNAEKRSAVGMLTDDVIWRCRSRS